MNILKLLAFKLLVPLTIFLQLGDAMAFFTKNTMFSAVQGTVTLNGVKLENAEVTQTYEWAWDNELVFAKTRSDSEGRFIFDRLEKSPGLSRFLPHEPVIIQTIKIIYLGNEHIAWKYTKHDYEEGGELGTNIIEITCELTDEPILQGDVYGICRFSKNK